MTGPEHYRQAERLLDLAHKHTDTGDARDEELATLFTARATAHATLALAAATAEDAVQRYLGNEAGTDRAWTQAVS